MNWWCEGPLIYTQTGNEADSQRLSSMLTRLIPHQWREQADTDLDAGTVAQLTGPALRHEAAVTVMWGVRVLQGESNRAGKSHWPASSTHYVDLNLGLFFLVLVGHVDPVLLQNAISWFGYHI